jgi:hypothetical protein
VGTVYAPDGRRIGIELGDEPDKVLARVQDLAKNFGAGYQFKVWECREVATSDSAQPQSLQ